MITPSNILADPSFDRLFNRNLAEFTYAYKKHYPEFEQPTPVDPLYHVISMFSYHELLIAHRIDEVALKQLFKYREDLDDLFSGQRHEDETDEAFRLRMRDETNSVSPAGHEFHYRNAAIKASPDDIVDARVTSGGGRNIHIYLLGNTEDGIPPLKVLEKTRAYFRDKRVAAFGDIISVIPATRKVLNVHAVIKLVPGIDLAYLDLLKAELMEHFRKLRRIGKGVSLSKIISKLQTDKVESVGLVLPVHDIIAEEYQYVDLVSTQLATS
jgi:phage-related baseplate assembly protein